MGVELASHIYLACGGRLDLPGGGNFTSPNYPLAYEDRMECVWTIENPNPTNSTILVKFSEFALEDHVICDFDRLHFRTGIVLFHNFCLSEVM